MQLKFNIYVELAICDSIHELGSTQCTICTYKTQEVPTLSLITVQKFMGIKFLEILKARSP